VCEFSDALLLTDVSNLDYQDLSASSSCAHTHGAEIERIKHTQKNTRTPTHSLSHTHAQTHTLTHAHRREMGDVRACGAIYTNTLLHVYLAKHHE